MKDSHAGKIKKMIRQIPGIGTYLNRESIREADKSLRVEISRRLDELLGVVEWIKTDQAKKGGWKHLNMLEDLSRDIEKVSRLIERAERGYASVFDETKTVTEKTLDLVYEYDKALVEDVDYIEEQIQQMTKSGTVPEETKVKEVREKIRTLEKKINGRKDVFKELK